MKVHLKDAEFVQRGKRWSQVMYLYYLLGWKMDQCELAFPSGVTLPKHKAFILALDGDVHFRPVDFELVRDRLCANEDVAACCNQIHPAGKGPMIWFQL